MPDLGYERCLRLSWTEDEFSINVIQEASVGRRRDDAFAAFDGRAPTDVRTARNHASAFPHPEIVARAGDIFGAPQDQAEVVAREAIAHKALGNDYFTFPDFMDVLTRAVLGITNEILSKPAWRSSRTWLFEAHARAQQPSTRRIWRSGLQRRLLGL